MKVFDAMLYSLKWGGIVGIPLTFIGIILMVLAPSTGLLVFLFVGFLLVPSALAGHFLDIAPDNNLLMLSGFIAIQWVYYSAVSFLIGLITKRAWVQL